ncbi:hypothetical protein [Brevibacterium sp. FAM 24630]|uniref:hypothetical protein n=1 Tax=Brevibacterium sp. FAM 24630 TaxID=3415680 RepID=UPI003C7EBBE8
MSDRLTALLDDAGGPPRLLLDAAAYAQHVILQDRAVPWHDATAFSNHLSSIQSLLGSEIVLIRLDDMLAEELETNSVLVEAMSAKTRKGFALRALLRDEALRAAVRALVHTATETQRSPVIIQLPSPKALLLSADAAADPDGGHEIDDDDVENAAVYCADWIRGFASVGIGGIIFDERTHRSPVEAYQPIANTTGHYGVLLGHRHDEVLTFDHGAEVPVAAPDVFTGAEAVGHVRVLFAEIPAETVPETVLERLTEMRDGLHVS